MRVLFVFKNENFLAPAGLCTIAGVVKDKGYHTYLCELNTHNPFEVIDRVKPHVIAYSASSGEAKHYLRLNSLIKERYPQIFTVMGGPHPTFYPDVVCQGRLDAICVGEGEEAFLDLLKAIDGKQSYDKIPNIVTPENKDRFRVRNLIEDLDSLPFPDYDLLYDNTPLGKYPLKSVITSRGCPYNCTYCFNSAWREIYKGKGKIIRRHSVNYIVDLLLYIKKRWPLSCVKFYDDIFVYRVDNWLEEFAEKYKRYIGLPFFILTRADLLTEEMVKLLKYAGCRTISMSIEAGNPDIRRDMLKRNMSNEQIIKAHRLCEKYGIYTFTNCIIGLPDTDFKNDLESVNLCIKAKVDWVEFLIFHPYPGTELGEYTIKKGYFKPDFEKFHTSYQYKSPLNCFTEREKNVQMNLGVLGPVAVVFPSFKNLILKFLIYFPHNFIYTIMYYLTKMYVFRKKIYVTKTNLWTSIAIFLRSLKQEWFRHENKKG